MMPLAITMCYPQRKNFISYWSLSFLREVSVLQQQNNYFSPRENTQEALTKPTRNENTNEVVPVLTGEGKR